MEARGWPIRTGAQVGTCSAAACLGGDQDGKALGLPQSASPRDWLFGLGSLWPWAGRQHALEVPGGSPSLPCPGEHGNPEFCGDFGPLPKSLVLSSGTPSAEWASGLDGWGGASPGPAPWVTRGSSLRRDPLRAAGCAGGLAAKLLPLPE